MSAQKVSCLIAGGAGFLGSELAEALLFQNCRVTVVDDLTSGKRNRLSQLDGNKNFLFLKGDINDRLPEEVKDQKFDVIFHLAGVEDHALEEETASLNTLRTNALGTINLLERACRDRARFLFASSIEVYLGVLSSLNLDHYFGQSTAEERRYSLAEAKRFGEALIWEYRKKYNLNARIVRLGEIYGSGMDPKSAASLGRFLGSIKNGEPLIIFGDGLKKEYYTHIRDVVFGLYQAAFARETAGKIYPLCDLKPVASLELAYLVQKIARPRPEIVFKPPLKEVEVPDIKIIDGQLQKDLGWQPKVELKEGIRELLEETDSSAALVVETEETPEPAPSPNPPPKEVTKPKTPKIHWKFPKLNLPKIRLGLLISSIVLGLSIAAPLLTAALSGLSGYRQLQRAETAVGELDFNEVVERAAKSQKAFSRGRRSLEALSWLYPFLGAKEASQEILRLLRVAGAMAKSVEHASRGVEPLLSLIAGITSSEAGDESALRTLALEAGDAKESLLLAEAEYAELKNDELPKLLRSGAATISAKVTTIHEGVVLLESLGKVLPKLLGFKEPQTYLILLQNPSELRPTGGFIGSYAELTMDKGRLTKLKVDDIYNPDGELDRKGVVVEPPLPLREHLGTDSWRMRDSNWAVDFPVAAQTAAEFYLEATGTDPHGVVGLDVFLIEDLLELTGPLTIESFGEVINSENIFEKAEFLAEAEYTNGSHRKRSFLAALADQLIGDLLARTKESGGDSALLSGLAAVVRENLAEKHLLLSFADTESAQLTKEQNWDGHIPETEGDYLFVVDANLGATKSNYFVRRSQKLEIINTDREGTIENTLTLTYVHQGTSDAWPGGPYKNYLRVLVPEGSWLAGATQTMEGLENKGRDITDQVITGGESGRTTFETVFTLNAGESLTLSLTYRLPAETYRPLSSESYQIFIQKQPGTAADPLTLEFLLPFGREGTNLPESFVRLGRLLKLSTNLSTDLDFSIPLD